MINTANQNIYGRDLDINFNKSIFGNNKNDPRLNAKSIKIKDQSSIIKKEFLPHVIKIMIARLGACMLKKLSMIRKRL